MSKIMESEVEQSAWVENYEWVCIVHSQDRRGNRTLITPLAFYRKGESCKAIAENERIHSFPNNGKVVCFRDFPEQEVNRLLSLCPERNWQSSLPENAATYSRYLIPNETRPKYDPLAQVFDWSSQASNLFDLPARLEQGIAAENCLSHIIFIRYQDRLYGPLHLEPDPKDAELLKPGKYLQPSSSGGPLLLLYGYPSVQERVLLLEKRQFIDPQTLGSPVSETDWSLPQATIKHALSASNDIKGREEQVRLVDKQLKVLAALSSSSGPQAARIKACILQRAQYIVQHQLERLGNLQDFIEGLSADHRLMQAARALEVQRRSKEIEQEAASQTRAMQQRLEKLQQDADRQAETERQRLQKLQNEVQAAQEELERLNREIAQGRQTRERLSTDFATLERLTQERLAELRQEPLRVFADLQLSGALSSAFFTAPAALPAEQPPFAVATQAAPQDGFFIGSATNISNANLLPWNAASEQDGDIESAKTCAVAFLAGLIPVIAEPASRTVLHTVARVLTGGRLWTVPVPLTALSPLDIFGHIATGQRMFVPTAGDLADILLEAQAHPDQLGVVLLEGVDRVPFLPVIVPLLQLYRSLSHQALYAEPLSLFHPRALLADDPYQALSRLHWPTNLLLAVTLDQELGSFPLPESYASWFVQIKTSAQPGIINPGKRECWQVPSANWQRWKREMRHLAASQPTSASLSALEPWQQLFYQALGQFDIQNKRIDIITQLWPQARRDQESKERVR